MTGVNLPNVAFIGRAGAGKTTSAQMLVERFGYERLSFAAPLKAGCGTTDDRGLLQRVGQGMRDLYEDFWVNLAIADMQARSVWNPGGTSEPTFVVDDCRYPNEAAALKAEGFVIVRVVASVNARVARLKGNGRLQDESQLQHVSETALDDFISDYRLINDGWPEDLLDKLTDILNRERS